MVSRQVDKVGRARGSCRCEARNVVSLAYGRCLHRARKDRRKAVDGFLYAWADRLKVDPGQLSRQPEVRANPVGESWLFRQKIWQRVMSRAWFRVDFDPDGNVVGVSNRFLPPASIAKIARAPAGEKIKGCDAIPAAAKLLSPRLTEFEAAETPKPRLFRRAATAVLCWKVKLRRRRDGETINVYLNAATSEEVQREHLRLRFDGRATVFFPNPMVVLHDTALTANQSLPATAYRSVVLPDLDGSGYLNGPYVTTAATSAAARLYRPSGDFSVARGTSGFLEAMAYYHIDAAQRRLQSLGFDAADYPVRVNVNATTRSESWFDRPTKTIGFGTGGVPDAEDAEVILHEYAHAVHNSIVPGFGDDEVSRPMSEGFADYFAASFFDADKTPEFRDGLASWDARGDGKSGDPPFLRRLDNTEPFNRHSPRIIEIWSSCLWNLRVLFGPKKADMLVIGSMYFIPRHPSFREAKTSILSANQYLFDGEGEQAIRTMFSDRGIT